MSARSSARVLWGVALVFALVAVGVAAAVFFSGPASVLHDVASAGRMPIPGEADVALAADRYGLYFGDLNAPTNKVMQVPRLDVTIVPPTGAPDPGYVNVDPKADVLVDGFHTVQVAAITVTRAGRYHVSVKGLDENGGSFSIGQLPATIPAARNVVRAWPFITLFLLVALVIGVTAAMSGHRGEA